MILISPVFRKVLLVTTLGNTVTLPPAAAGAGPYTIVVANAATTSQPTKLQTSGSGSFWNLSQGTFISVP